jgi:hypothetical protein
LKSNIQQVEQVEELHIGQPDLQMELVEEQEQELYHGLYPVVAKQPTAVPDEQADGCNGVGHWVDVQQKDHRWEAQEQKAKEREQLCHDLCHDLCHAVEKEARQPTAVPNAQEDDYILEQQEQEQKDYGSEEGAAVGVEAGPYAACGHDVECDDGQDYQEPVDPVRSVGQQFGHVEESLEESVPF